MHWNLKGVQLGFDLAMDHISAVCLSTLLCKAFANPKDLERTRAFLNKTPYPQQL